MPRTVIWSPMFRQIERRRADCTTCLSQPCLRDNLSTGHTSDPARALNDIRDIPELPLLASPVYPRLVRQKNRTDRPTGCRAKPPCQGPVRRKAEIPCAKDFFNAFHVRRQTRYLADGQSHLLARAVEPCFENPCVGGSIPPRATKNK
jgi:hypothetical protein